MPRAGWNISSLFGGTLVQNQLMEELASAVLWISPNLTIREANRSARALLARIDELGHRTPRLARANEGEIVITSAAEAAAIRKFLGAPFAKPRRARIQLYGFVMDAGVAPIHGSNGEFLGWLVDAAAPCEWTDSAGLNAYTNPMLRIDGSGTICELNSAALALFEQYQNDLPVAARDVRGSDISTVMGCSLSDNTQQIVKTNFVFPVSGGKLVASLAAEFGANRELRGGIVALSIVSQSSSDIDLLEREAEALIANASRLVSRVEALAHNDVTIESTEPVGVV
ncbi:MAG: hypothetical protein ACKVS6_11550 [Planctomycetota bacterium]